MLASRQTVLDLNRRSKLSRLRGMLASCNGAVGAMLCYAVAVAGFFWQLLFLPNVSVPKGGGDLVSFLYPTYSFAAENLQRGVLPLWNPYLFAGSPFAADLQSGLYYPPNLIAFLVARPFTYSTIEALAVAHFFLAATFTYLLARELGLTVRGSFAAGLIYAFGGFNVAHLAHLNMLAAASWLPLILALLHRALQRSSLGWAAAAGLSYGVAVLAGHTQISLYTALLMVLYFIWCQLWSGWAAVRSGWLKPLAVLGLSYAVAIGIAAVQLLPLAELLQRSVRADLAYGRALEFAASPLGLITMLVPHFFGESPADYWGVRWSLTESYAYVGILTWSLAALAILIRIPRHRATVFWLTAALLSLFVALGEQTVLHGWLYRFVPGFDKVRAAARSLVVLNLAAALLGGQGFALLETPLRARWRPMYAVVLRASGAALGVAALVVAPLFYFALLTSQDKDATIFRRVGLALDSFNLSLLFLGLAVAVLALGRWRPGRSVPYLALALLTVDLFSANARLNPTTEDLLKGFHHPEIVGFLQQSAPGERVDTATGIADVWQPDSGMLYALPDVLGLFDPMQLADYQRYWENLGSRSVPGYDFLRAKYVLARKDVSLDWQKFELAMEGGGEINVYRNRSALPPAFFAETAEAMPLDKQLERLRAPDFDPRQTVLLERAGSEVAGSRGNVIDWRYLGPNEVKLTVDNSRPGYVVLSEVFYPGWRAYVDGEESPVLRANYAFRSVLVPGGAREVRLVFTPSIWYAGLAISLTTLSALGLWAVLRWRFGQKPR